MGFNLVGPTRQCTLSNVDDAGEASYDVLALAETLGIRCPQLSRLHERFYETTVIRFEFGEVDELLEDLNTLKQAYKDRNATFLRRRSRARDENVKRQIITRMLAVDPVYDAIECACDLCDDALRLRKDITAFGD